MKSFVLGTAAIVFAILAIAPVASAFDWKDVVKMRRADIADSLILQKIEYSGTTFRLDADEIEALQEAGVSDAVISAMLRTEAEEDDGEAYDDSDRYGYDDGYYAYPHYYYPRRRLYVGLGLGYYGPYPRYYGPYYDSHYYYPRHRSRYGRTTYRGHSGPSTHRDRTRVRAGSYSGYGARHGGASPYRERTTVGQPRFESRRAPAQIRGRSGRTSGPSATRRR